MAKNNKITQIKALEILDSRGNPTVQVTVFSGKEKARACVPSGASTGIHEAVELRDGDKKRYHGKGVTKVIKNIETKIAPKLKNKSLDQIDKILLELDKTDNKSQLGANAILGISLASARLSARLKNKTLYQYINQVYKFKNKTTLPIPMFNVINGGQHADSGLDVQEFMLVPAGIKKYHLQLRAGSEIFHTLKKVLANQNLRTAVGDEGGFAPKIKTNTQALDILVTAIKQAGYRPGKDIFIALDVAASAFYQNDKYSFEGKKIYSGDLIEIYTQWLKKYPIISIEDGLAEDDWTGWHLLTQKLTKKSMLVGDDIFTTNVDRLKHGFEMNVANSILIKPNQIGTLKETIECIQLAQKNNYKVVISHRSGETTDPFIADLAVASGAEFIKTGAPNRGERVAKYNRLLEIEFNY
ncbi:MAG: phosphopyruvate hydratase [Patescibacteria group bacterium]|nr:phosphopyruvate hydratase [Patescibacteria group bacterium]